MVIDARYGKTLGDGRVRCEVCPRGCELGDGQRGLCFVRMNEKGTLRLATYGRSSGFCVDPIEKKPLNHFLPGSSVLSFGTAGCNLTCKFCQNWDISKSRDTDRLSASAMPDDIARAAQQRSCASVAYTYNDPVIFLEYAVDTAAACREIGVRSVAVTAGYVLAEPRAEFFAVMDAANVDLKAFSESFYHRICGASLEPVKETLVYLVHETRVWTEITTLLIPGENDSEAEITALTEWVAEALGTHVPLHFTAFHPDWRMRDHSSTPLVTLMRAREIAQRSGILHVYTGNVRWPDGSTTWCASCGAALIVRDGYRISAVGMSAGACIRCGARCPGVF